MSKIFISYRRDDSADVTGRIGDRLRQHFGDENIFTDVDNIPLGVDFRAYLDAAVSQCDVLLAVIGRDWLTVENEDGGNRLSDPADFVRIEIESALQRGIPVIPLLVRGAKMPRQNQLPDSIESLAFRNAQPIRSDPDFKNDTGRLISSLVQHLQTDNPETVPNSAKDATNSVHETVRTSVSAVEWDKPQSSESDQHSSTHDKESEHLTALRKELLTARSRFDYENVKYELEKHLADFPNTINARVLLDKVNHALHSLDSEDHRPTKPATKSGSSPFQWLRSHSVLVGGVGAIVAAFGIYPLIVQEKNEPLIPPVSQTAPGEPIPNNEVETIDYIPPDMVQIPAGTFLMGSETSDYDDERPVHQVTVPTFELARNELTWAEWQLCEDDAGCKVITRPGYFDQIDAAEQLKHPVVNVNTDSVDEYIDWINGKTGLSYRLPSEAEWEYAARAGSGDNYSWGAAIGSNRANCEGCGSRWDNQSTAPVGSFSENSFGLNDMHGNVWETVADCWHDTYEGAPDDGSAWLENCTDDSHSPLRGGSWDDAPVNLRSAPRFRNYTGDTSNDIGFRLARTLP